MTSGAMCQHDVVIIDKGQSPLTFRFFQLVLTL